MSITHLIALLDNNAPSFCYYQNTGKSKLMEYQILQKLIALAKEKGLIVNFIYGSNRLPEQYDSLINTVEHVKFVPPELCGVYQDAILVLNSNEKHAFHKLSENLGNVILRLHFEDLADCDKIMQLLVGKFKRLNLCLLDMHRYKEEEFRLYQQQLQKLAELMTLEYRLGNLPEISIFSDRMLLQEMNNCGAGVLHVTAAPNGRFYLCPGFYYEQPEQYIGEILSGIHIKNNHLNTLEHSPICGSCDAYHCKRCIFLNHQTTGENNTPSRQQCVLSHLERNQARDILEDIRTIDSFAQLPSIPKLNYLDPFLIVSGQIKREQAPFETGLHFPNEDVEIKEMLRKIYGMQVELMRSLRNQ